MKITLSTSGGKNNEHNHKKNRVKFSVRRKHCSCSPSGNETFKFPPAQKSIKFELFLRRLCQDDLAKTIAALWDEVTVSIMGSAYKFSGEPERLRSFSTWKI
ncbi:hypothetical protein BaRGS_00028605 [Batillaria attramentaria]|uniref:Uncharacterized protein n=1 Tax=Batillaria attramentaria TaxID=370345 RepID=A0ABD0JZP7_9CAEN